MPRGSSSSRPADEQQDASVVRKEPKPPEHVFREHLKKHAAHKALLYDGGGLSRTDVRKVGLSRLQFGDVEFLEPEAWSDTPGVRAAPLVQMEQPVLLHRTLSRTAGLAPWSRRRTAHGPDDDSDSSSDSGEAVSNSHRSGLVSTSLSDGEDQLWEVGISGFLQQERCPAPAALQQLGSTSPALQPADLTAGPPAGHSTAQASGRNPRSSSFQLRLDPQHQTANSAAADAGTAIQPPAAAAGAAGGGELAACPSPRLVAPEDSTATSVSDRPTERVDRLLKGLRSNDPHADASLFVGGYLRRAARASSSEADLMRSSRSATTASSQGYDMDSQLLQANVLAADLSRYGAASGGRTTSNLAPSTSSRSRRVTGTTGDAGRRSTEVTESGWMPAAGAGAPSQMLRAPSRPQLLQALSSAVLGSSPSSPSLTLAPDGDLPLSTAGTFPASPTASGKLLRVSERSPLTPTGSLPGGPTLKQIDGAPALTSRGVGAGGARASRLEGRRQSLGLYTTAGASGSKGAAAGTAQQQQQPGGVAARVAAVLSASADFANGIGGIVGGAVDGAAAIGFGGDSAGGGSGVGGVAALRLPALAAVGGARSPVQRARSSTLVTLM